MDEDAIERAMERLAGAVEGRTDPADVDAALERARSQIEALAQAAAELESTLPDRVGDAVRDGVRAEALPVARQVGEVRGLMNAFLRRLERIEGDLLAERHARVDDLALLVDLITSGWKSVDARLERIEQALQAGGGAVVYRIEERRPSAETS
ncbi:MAG: hypothetical protein ACRDN6_10370 [Gaiellaceae bacterium]